MFETDEQFFNIPKVISATKETPASEAVCTFSHSTQLYLSIIKYMI